MDVEFRLETGRTVLGHRSWCQLAPKCSTSLTTKILNRSRERQVHPSAVWHLSTFPPEKQVHLPRNEMVKYVDGDDAPDPPALPVAAQYSPYCGRAHRFEAERVVAEKTGGSGCSGFKLQELDPSHAKYESVKTQFTTKWEKSPSAPTVASIFSIKVSRYL